MITPCKCVRMLCREEPLLIPMYKSVKMGSRMLECMVSYCSPNPCVIVPSTFVSFERYVDYSIRELEHNIMVKMRFTKATETYIYPKKTWFEIRKRFLEPLSRGMPPREQGALLYGPPGTGKTSMTQIISFILGLNVVEAEPGSILSKYLGESEKNFDRTLRRAEESEPSVLLLDDAEWLASSRKLHSAHPEESRAYLSMLKSLFKYLQKWYREGRRTIGLLTTNVSADAIDPALRRAGRLGRPIFFPLPDFEAVHTLLIEMGIDPSRAESLAVKIVNSGLPMSDVVSIAKDILNGFEPTIEPKEESGYIRFIPPTLSQATVSWLRRVWSDYCLGLKKGSRLWFPLSSTVSIPLAAVAIGVVCRKPVIILSDPRNVDDALATAKMSEAVLIVDAELMGEDIIKFIVSKSGSVPVIFAGSSTPNVSCFPISINFKSPGAPRKAVAEVLSKVFELSISDKDLRDIMNMSDSDWERILKMLGVFRASPYVIRKKVMPA